VGEVCSQPRTDTVYPHVAEWRPALRFVPCLTANISYGDRPLKTPRPKSFAPHIFKKSALRHNVSLAQNILSVKTLKPGDYPHLTTETPRAQRKRKNILFQCPLCLCGEKRSLRVDICILVGNHQLETNGKRMGRQSRRTPPRCSQRRDDQGNLRRSRVTSSTRIAATKKFNAVLI